MAAPRETMPQPSAQLLPPAQLQLAREAAEKRTNHERKALVRVRKLVVDGVSPSEQNAFVAFHLSKCGSLSVTHGAFVFSNAHVFL